jgi:hypothetical protein
MNEYSYMPNGSYYQVGCLNSGSNKSKNGCYEYFDPQIRG